MKEISKKMGRPTENPKIIRLQIRADKQTVTDLDDCAAKLNISRSEVVRAGIQMVKDSMGK